MLQFIALFCPGFLSLEVYDLLTPSPSHETTSLYQFLQRYGMFTLLDLFVPIIVVKLLHPQIDLTDGMNLSMGVLQGLYFIISFVAAIFWGYLYRVFRTHCKFTIETDPALDQDDTSELKG